ncbi:MAG: hypothetical protein FWC60_03670 [Firmicutes bacterium]|nr:hypothetical protein [Bacillota bacterium]
MPARVSKVSRFEVRSSRFDLKLLGSEFTVHALLFGVPGLRVPTNTEQ